MASVNRSVEGDINGDNRVSVGDLAMVVKAYGRILTDTEWAEYVRADVNQDGQVDIEDLTFIARLILN
ncbi:Dockerin type I repeat protein [compost metagenome]